MNNDMCGILFYDCGKTGSDPETILKAHAVLLNHRGPDASEATVFGKHVLSFCRLAIMNTEASNKGLQPFDLEDVTMVCNGEIYNYKDLTPPGVEMRSDVDVILHTVCHPFYRGGMGIDRLCRAVAKLDGDFAFVASDGNRILAGRDPLGVRPLFFGTDEDKRMVAIASEAKALVGAPGVVRISVFPPGTVYVNGVFHRYHAIAPASPIQSDPRVIQEFHRLFVDSVSKRVLHSERPVALLCSGGIDSSAMVSVVARNAETFGWKPSDVKVFSMKYRSGHSDDAFYASLLCKHLGFDFEIVEFGPEDLGEDTVRSVIRSCETCDPNTVRAAIPMWLLAKHISTKTDCKVILSGEGADELLGGYGYFRLAPDEATAADECVRLLRNLHMFDLLRADRCFAAHGLEARVPFLDPVLVDFAAGLVSPNREKALLRKAMEGYDELSRFRILDRPKEKFSDGTGFSYVPDLLRRIALSAGKDEDDGTMNTRLRLEKSAYRTEFERAFPGVDPSDWVIERTMPRWTDEARSKAAGSTVSLD